MDCSGFENCLAIRLHCVKIATNWKLMHNRPIELQCIIDLRFFCNPRQPWQDGWDGTVICNRRAISDCVEIVRFHGIAAGFTDCWWIAKRPQDFLNAVWIAPCMMQSIRDLGDCDHAVLEVSQNCEVLCSCPCITWLLVKFSKLNGLRKDWRIVKGFLGTAQSFINPRDCRRLDQHCNGPLPNA